MDKENNAVEKLLKESESLDKQINKLKQKLLAMKEKNNNPQAKDYYYVEFEIDELRKKIWNKECFLAKIKERLKLYSVVYSSAPTFTNTIVDLHKKDNNGIQNNDINGEYIVSLHSDKTIVGIVGYGKDACFDDNFFYVIDEEYRNQGLGFQAACALLEYLSLSGIEHVTFHIEKSNVASIRVAEKIKNVYQECEIEDNDYSITYHFNINDKLINNRPSTK